MGALTPIPKTTKPTIDDNPPISILPTPAKLLKKIVRRKPLEETLCSIDAVSLC